MNETEQCMQSYNRIMNANPILNPEEETSLIKTFMKHKGGKTKEQAREKLFYSNIKMVMKEANFYRQYSYSASLQDLVQAGLEGLGIAIDRFNPKKYHTKLSTYAVPWIKLKIFQILTKSNSMVHTPPHIINQAQKYREVVKNQDENNVMTDQELMKSLDVTERGLRNIRMAHKPVLSLDASLYSEHKLIEDSGSEVSLQDTMEDNRSPNAVKEVYKKESKSLLLSYLDQLKPLHREILVCRYINDEKDDLQTIGKRFGVTGERVRQIEYNALKILRKRIKDKTQFAF